MNLPFGLWRARARRFSTQWFLAVHLPVPAVVSLRLLSGIGWRLDTLPVLVGAFMAGQFAGGRIARLFPTKAAKTQDVSEME
jgi:hypothetical protein